MWGGKSAGTFKRFLRDLGLGPKQQVSEDDAAYWKQRAEENVGLALQAFERKSKGQSGASPG